MVYRKRRTFRRKRFSRKRYGRRRGAKLGTSIRRTVTRMAETKRITETAVTQFSSVGNSWVYWIPTTVQSAAFASARIGRRVSVVGYRICGLLHGGQNATVADDAYNKIRIVIGYQATHGISVGTIVPLQGVGFSDPISKTETAGPKYTRIFRNQYLTLKSSGPDTVGYMPAMRNINIKHFFKKPITVTYADDTQYYPDKCFFMAMITDSTAVPNPGFIDGYFRLYYKDI